MSDTLLFSQGFTDDQLVLVEQNSLMVEERERDIQQIAQSISDLNEIFRDLAGMVVEQVSVISFVEEYFASEHLAVIFLRLSMTSRQFLFFYTIQNKG